jgi:hypothetical protein
MARRWYQFNLKSLMAIVAMICLGLGGWHLLLKYGRYVEAEPALVGQPIKIHGRFLHFFAGADSGQYELIVRSKKSSFRQSGIADRSGWGRYAIEAEYESRFVDRPEEFTVTLTPKGGTPILGSFVVRGAE